MLHNNRWDTDDGYKPSAGDTRRLDLPAMTQCPQISILKYCYRSVSLVILAWVLS